MNEAIVEIVRNGSEDELYSNLIDFNVKNAQIFHFPDFTVELKQSFFEALFHRLSDKLQSRTYVTCLETIRILSREKSGLESVATENALKTLLSHAGLVLSLEDESGEGFATIQDAVVIIEAQKCLCNIIFNCQAAQRICSTNGCIEGIVQRLKTYKDPTLVHEIKFFDMRILFVLTALCRDVRPKLRQDLHGLTYLIEVLDLTLRGADEAERPVSDPEVDLCCEVLKILFNITVATDSSNMDEEEEAHFLRLVSVLHDLLLCQTATKEKRDELHNHTVNLLTNMPRESYEELLAPVNEDTTGAAEQKDIEYDGKNMEAVVKLLEFLENRLEVPQQSLKESLAPVLHCLCQICRANRSIRKFCRLKALPYLRNEVKYLPQEGNLLRNKLCRMFTSPVVEVKELAADFLFVLCKSNVTRFVKYTGYGNAAGLLAQRGLMCGGRGEEYLSESEDSETEEYSELKDNINPVTGRWELPKPNPMEGMSDEQKEYEAMQLVEKLDKLQRAGVIQPTKISEGGKPVPMEHMAEMLEGVSEPPHLSDSESD